MRSVNASIAHAGAKRRGRGTAVEHDLERQRGQVGRVEDALSLHVLPLVVQTRHGPIVGLDRRHRARKEQEPTLAELRERWLAPLERSYLRELLERSGGNVRRAAQKAGLNPVTLYRLLEKRGMGRSRDGRRPN